TFIANPAIGGQSVREKIQILLKMPSILRTVRKAVKTSDYFQFRAPTGIGIYVIPFLIGSSKQGWFKYAGNWNQDNAPLAYRLQRWLLKRQQRKVTINGFWNDQPKHCLSFENPCLTSEEIAKGQESIRLKRFVNGSIELCFVGRVEEEKGVGLLIEALLALPDEEKQKLKTVHIVGDGKKAADYQKLVKTGSVDFVFHGLLSRDQVHDIYKRSHIFLLPSASEGFPKVISEAMNYGCIPVVSDVSSISHYIQHESNGFLIVPLTTEGLIDQLINVLNLKEEAYKSLVKSAENKINKFTYSYYNKRIIEEIIEG
ncbi:MAG: glycosyltransferase family 4 protein, partial [Psychroserpens sp.]|nr:glycosyltransferase family 4 protein [Psychroserpens sp.]